MRFHTLDGWLRWQEQLAPRKIDLGLQRVRQVWQRLGLSLDSTVITVAGTNGKGSTIAIFEALLRQGGYRTASYTSPHLVRYNERIRIGGVPVEDARILGAFDAIDRARGELPLTYFEFGTLAALWIMAREPLDVALLEVGLGGRLDAVNIVDTDLAVVTSIGLDHQSWLGDDLETIAREKAGIFRPNRPAVFSSPEMPASIAEVAGSLGAPLYRNGRDFHLEEEGRRWKWCGPERCLDALPPLPLPGRHQMDNAAGVLMALELLSGRLPLTETQIREGLERVSLPGRIQVLELDGVNWILDVAHNPHAVLPLKQELLRKPARGRTFALLGMLKDKEAGEVIGIMGDVVDLWHHATLKGERGLGAEALARYQPGHVHDSVEEGVAALRKEVRPGDRVVVFGSFHTVGDALPLLVSSA